MDSRYILLALPVFGLAILLELLVSRRQVARGSEPHFRLYDSLASLGGGIGQQAILGLLAVTVSFGYQLVQTHAGLWSVSPRSGWAWLALFFLDDLCYYAYHAASHRVNILWATHVAHHHSEEYNLTTALRQSWFTNVYSWVFYLPIALLGFPFGMWLTMHTLNILYQFWIHTRTIGTLGPLEWFLNTPAHHRVHHGINPHYIDKNHGGILILWDRLFGTFAKEQDEPVYGTVKPLASFNPVWGNVEEWLRLLHICRTTHRLRDKLAIWFQPPEWRPADLGGPVAIPPITRSEQRRHVVHPGRRRGAFAIYLFTLSLGSATLLLAIQNKLSVSWHVYATLHVILLLGVMGGLLEQRPWARPLELVRVLALGPLWWLVPASAQAIFLVVWGAQAVLALWSLTWTDRAAPRPAADLPGLPSKT